MCRVSQPSLPVVSNEVPPRLIIARPQLPQATVEVQVLVAQFSATFGGKINAIAKPMSQCFETPLHRQVYDLRLHLPVQARGRHLINPCPLRRRYRELRLSPQAPDRSPQRSSSNRILPPRLQKSSFWSREPIR